MASPYRPLKIPCLYPTLDTSGLLPCLLVSVVLLLLLVLPVWSPKVVVRSPNMYPLSPAEQKELDVFLKENLETGRIQPSKSPILSPVFFIKKKDGSLRLVQDYRALNTVTVKNKYPLPLISELINKLQGAKYFTKLDVCWGFNNVWMKVGDEWKAAFRTNRGLYEPLVMFFGLTNSPATFQTMMDGIFKELISEGVVVKAITTSLHLSGDTT